MSKKTNPKDTPNVAHYRKTFSSYQLGEKLRNMAEEASKGAHVDMPVIRDLIAAGAQLTVYYNDGFGDIDYSTALLFAVQGSQLELATALLEAGAPISQGNWGITPLYIAISNGDMAIVKLLVKHGVDVNEKTWTHNSALIEASEEGQAEIVAYLLSQGADPSAKTRMDKTALDLAREKGNKATVKVLQDWTISKNKAAIRKVIDAGIQNNKPLPKRPALRRNPKPPGI